MDRNTILALVLIFIIILLWGPYLRMFYPPPPETPETTQGITEDQPIDKEQPQTSEKQIQPESVAAPEISTGTIQKTNLPEQSIVIESPLYRGVLSTKGGTITEWHLIEQNDNNEYKYPDPSGDPVNIIRNNTNGNLAVSFFSAEGYAIDLADFDFIPENVLSSGGVYKLNLFRGSRTITLTADLGDDRFIHKLFTFDPNSYAIEMEIQFVNCQSIVLNKEYTLSWGTGIRTTEKNSGEDMRWSKSMALYGSSVEKFDVGNDAEKINPKLDGVIHWISTKSKYFCALIIPEEIPGISAQFSGKNILELEDVYPQKNYITSLIMGYTPEAPVFTNSFLVYLGPLNRDNFKTIAQDFGKDLRLIEVLDINPFFLTSLIRPLSLFIYKIFTFLHNDLGIQNYGIVIIIFSFLINLVMFPLTAKSYKSMKKMQELQPLLNELREKYKKEPQKVQQAQLKLYKEKKINPLGGCLPMLLQMPIFFAIYPIFRSIELRGAPFFGWITDLSQPDTVATLSFSLPLYGNQVNILTVIYAISLFIQQKIMMKDPKQKALVYIMPIMLLLVLNRLSSGFILYFIIFNLLSITQRYIVRDKSVPAPKSIPAPVPAARVKSQSKKSSKKGKKK